MDAPIQVRERIHRNLVIDPDAQVANWKLRIQAKTPYRILVDSNSLTQEEQNNIPHELPMYALRCRKMLIGNLKVSVDGESVGTYSRVECASMIGEYLIKVIANSNSSIPLNERTVALGQALDYIKQFDHNSEFIERIEILSRNFFLQELSPKADEECSAINYSDLHCFLSTLALYDPHDTKYRYSASFDKKKEFCKIKRKLEIKESNCQR